MATPTGKNARGIPSDLRQYYAVGVSGLRCPQAVLGWLYYQTNFLALGRRWPPSGLSMARVLVYL